MRVLLDAALKDDLYQLDLFQIEVLLKPRLHALMSNFDGNLFAVCDKTCIEVCSSLVVPKSVVLLVDCYEPKFSAPQPECVQESCMQSFVCIITSNQSSTFDANT